MKWLATISEGFDKAEDPLIPGSPSNAEVPDA
jgi:hypothetical protein